MSLENHRVATPETENRREMLIEGKRKLELEKVSATQIEGKMGDVDVKIAFLPSYHHYDDEAAEQVGNAIKELFEVNATTRKVVLCEMSPDQVENVYNANIEPDTPMELEGPLGIKFHMQKENIAATSLAKEHEALLGAIDLDGVALAAISGQVENLKQLDLSLTLMVTTFTALILGLIGTLSIPTALGVIATDVLTARINQRFRGENGGVFSNTLRLVVAGVVQAMTASNAKELNQSVIQVRDRMMALNAYASIQHNVERVSEDAEGAEKGLSTAIVLGEGHRNVLPILESLLSGERTPESVATEIGELSTASFKKIASFLSDSYRSDMFEADADADAEATPDKLSRQAIEKVAENLPEILEEVASNIASSVGRVTYIDPYTQEKNDFVILIKGEDGVNVQKTIYDSVLEKREEVPQNY